MTFVYRPEDFSHSLESTVAVKMGGPISKEDQADLVARYRELGCLLQESNDELCFILTQGGCEWHTIFNKNTGRFLCFNGKTKINISVTPRDEENPLMDKAMRKVSKEIRKGEKVIENATKKNDKLANYDEKVRDPMIAKYKKLKKK